MKIGIAVQGPSDREFFDKVLHKHFHGITFDVRNLKSQHKLIRQAPALLETFRGAGYCAGFILVDRDDSTCISAVFKLFDKTIQETARQPRDSRYLHICVAIRELEAWYLADSQAIAAIFPKASYSSAEETGSLNAEAKIRDIWQQQYGSCSAVNKIDLAKTISTKFHPAKAQTRSKSFAYFWNMLGKKIASVKMQS